MDTGEPISAVSIAIPLDKNELHDIANSAVTLGDHPLSCSPEGNFNSVLWDFMSITGMRMERAMDDAPLQSFEETIMDQYYDDVFDLYCVPDTDLETARHKADEYLSNASYFANTVFNVTAVQDQVNQIKSKFPQAHITLELNETRVMNNDSVLFARFAIKHHED